MSGGLTTDGLVTRSAPSPRLPTWSRRHLNTAFRATVRVACATKSPAAACARTQASRHDEVQSVVTHKVRPGRRGGEFAGRRFQAPNNGVPVQMDYPVRLGSSYRWIGSLADHICCSSRGLLRAFSSPHPKLCRRRKILSFAEVGSLIRWVVVTQPVELCRIRGGTPQTPGTPQTISAGLNARLAIPARPECLSSDAGAIIVR